MATLRHTLDLGALGDVDVDFEYAYRPGTPATMYAANGDPGDPGEPDDFQIIAASVAGKDITVLFCDPSDDLIDELRYRAVESDADAAADARARNRADDRVSVVL